MNSLTKFFSKLADAPSIVAVGALVAVVLLAQRKWRIAVLVPIILAFELLTFLSITYPVHRRRPDVVHLGSVPSTGSFPSGHIAATLVLYGLVVLLLWYSGASLWLLVPASAWVAVAAAFVGWSRFYRGMHQPLDVAAGALLGMGVLASFRPVVREAVVADKNRSSMKRDSQEPTTTAHAAWPNTTKN